jgi:hypothetical protein
MNLKEAIDRQVKEYKAIRGCDPDVLYMTETAFLYLLMQLHDEFKDGPHCTLINDAVRQGAVHTARRVRFMNMRIFIKEESSKSFYVRQNAELDDGKGLELSKKSKSLFGEIFGRGGLFDKIFGGGKYE